MNTMASSVSVIPTQHHMDRLDAARALLGVSPSSHTPDSDDTLSPPNTSRLSAASVSFGGSRFFGQTAAQKSRESLQGSSVSSPSPLTTQSLFPSPPSYLVGQSTNSTSYTSTNSRTVSFENPHPLDQPAADTTPTASPRLTSIISSSSNNNNNNNHSSNSSCSGLNALDALAALASSEQASLLQQQALPPQPAFVGTGPALFVSALKNSPCSSSSSDDDDDSDAMPPPPPRGIAAAAAAAVKGGRRRSVSNPEGMEKWAPLRYSRRDFVLPASILEEELAEASAAMEAHSRRESAASEEEAMTDGKHEPSKPQKPTITSSSLSSAAPISGLMSEEEQANLTPEELLKRARSRLLEDLSEGSLNGEKGVLTLPHSLSKYKEVYNKNGRIGIYTPAERAAIIARFQSKRSRRVWNKKIRYNCRKNLADRRMRVKGRFVKRSTEEQAKAVAAVTGDAKEESNGAAAAGSAAAAEDTTPEPSETADEDMPDVTDPDAGFCPTDDQPYRRTRRHTIT